MGEERFSSLSFFQGARESEITHGSFLPELPVKLHI